MTKSEIKRLRKILDDLHDCREQLDELREKMQERADKMRERYENMSEKGQESDNGQKLEAAVSQYEDTIYSIEEIINNLDYAEDARPSEDE